MSKKRSARLVFIVSASWKVTPVFSVIVTITVQGSLKKNPVIKKWKALPIEILRISTQSGHYESLAVHLVVERRVQADV